MSAIVYPASAAERGSHGFCMLEGKLVLKKKKKIAVVLHMFVMWFPPERLRQMEAGVYLQCKNRAPSLKPYNTKEKNTWKQKL